MTRPQTLPRSRKKIFACILAGRTHHVIKIIASVCLESSCHRNLSNGDGEKCMHWSRWKYIFLRYRFRGGLSHRGWSFWHQTYDKTTLDAASIVSIHSIGLEEYVKPFTSGFVALKYSFVYVRMLWRWMKSQTESLSTLREFLGSIWQSEERNIRSNQCDGVRSR